MTDDQWENVVKFLRPPPTGTLAIGIRKRMERILGLYELCTMVEDHPETPSETIDSLDRLQSLIGRLHEMLTFSSDSLTLAAAEAIQEQEFKRALEAAGVPREQFDAGSCFHAFNNARASLTVLSRLCRAARAAIQVTRTRHRPTRGGLTMIVHFLDLLFEESYRCTDHASSWSKAECREEFILSALEAGGIPRSGLSARQLQRHLARGKSIPALSPGEF